MSATKMLPFPCLFSDRLCGVHLPNGFTVRSNVPTSESEFAEWPFTCALFKVNHRNHSKPRSVRL